MLFADSDPAMLMDILMLPLTRCHLARFHFMLSFRLLFTLSLSLPPSSLR